MKVISLNQALRQLKKISPEIRYKGCVEGKKFSAGLIAFKLRKDSDPKQILHRDKDVVCHVLRGRGYLRINDRRMALKPGTICHIPKGTGHDFAAEKKEGLLLFYCLIKTG